MKQQAWLWYLALAVALGQYYFVSSVGRSADDALYTAVGWTSVVAVGVGIALFGRRAGWRSAVGWSLILVALVLYLVGDAVYSSLEESNGFVEFPSSADWLYLAMYPAVLAGVVLVRSAVSPGRDRVAGLDAVTVAVAAFGVIGALYMYPYLTDDTFGRDAQIVASAYPLLDIVLVGAATWLVVRRGPVADCLRIVAVAFVSIVVGNAVFNVAALSFSFEPGGVADLAWLGFMVLLGAAALHPSAGERGERVDTPSASRRRRSATVPLLATGVVPLAHWRWADGEYMIAAVATTVVALCLIGLRLALSGSPSPETDATDESGSGTFDHVPSVDASMPRPPLTSIVEQPRSASSA